MSDQKPHVLSAIASPDGYVRWEVECPYDIEDPSRDRPCLLGAEPDNGCLWYDRWENGEHHPDCADEATCPTITGLPDAVQQCWDDAGLRDGPPECDGFDVHELGHAHFISGCWLIQQMDDLGWEDGVVFDTPRYEVRSVGRTGQYRWQRYVHGDVRLVLPMEVTLGNDDGLILLKPVDESLIVVPDGAISDQPFEPRSVREMPVRTIGEVLAQNQSL